MAGLPCTVSAVFAFALLGTVTESAFVCQTPVSPKVSQAPEKCMNKVETGSEMSNEERQSAVDAINTYRAFIANQCEFRFEKPKSANFLKIRYACDMEAYAKFDCPLYGTDFGPDERIFRTTFDVKESSVFFNIAPRINEIDFNQNQKFRTFNSPDELFHGALVLLFYLNNEAEIGCYKKTCYSRAYIACTTYTDIKNPLRPLYIAGSRCQSNVDCTDPGYPICDMEYGLCEQGNLPYRCGQHKEPEVRLKSEVCLDRLETGSRMSNAERQLIVDGMNLHRGFITNQCAAWGSGKPASANMLKVHYNCELEKQVKFECPEAGPENWKSDDMVFRQISSLVLTVSRTSIMWRLSPTLKTVKIDANTQTLENATLKWSEFLSFALNNNVSEVGCFLKECHRQEYIACTTGHPFDVTKPLYKRGNRCQKDTDCIVAGYHICNMEFGLCDKGGDPPTTTTESTTMLTTTTIPITAESTTTSTAAESTTTSTTTNTPTTTESMTTPTTTESTTTPTTTESTTTANRTESMTTPTSTTTPTTTESTTTPTTTESTTTPTTTESTTTANRTESMTTTPTTTKPRQGCQRDADCTDAAFPVCNLKSRLCGPLKCTFSDDKLTVDACKDLRACTEATDKTEPEKQFCRSTVIIAKRNNDNTFTVQVFGAAVSENHLLTSMISEFKTFESSELHVIVGGTSVYLLRSADVFPPFDVGSVSDVNAWKDLVLVKLAATSAFKFIDYLNVKGVSPDSQDKSLTLRMDANMMNIEDRFLQPDAECVKIFPPNKVIRYVPNSNMACGLDDNDKGTRYLSGVPLADMTLTDGKHTLHGIRSMKSLDPQHSNGFLVTKLAPHCDWLFRVSKCAVKCV